MKAIKFKKSNIEIAKDQDEYKTLPAEIKKDGEVIFCYELTFRERLRVLFGENLYISQFTFNKPLQPQRLEVGYPEKTYSFWDWTENKEKKNEKSVKGCDLTVLQKEILEKSGIDYE